MMAQVLGGLVFEEESEQEAFKRRFRMFQNVLQESWVYQEIGQEFLEKGLEKGREEERQKRVQGLRQTIVSGLQMRFPQTLALAMQQIDGIEEPEVLQTVLSRLFAAQTAEEARQILLEVKKQ